MRRTCFLHAWFKFSSRRNTPFIRKKDPFGGELIFPEFSPLVATSRSEKNVVISIFLSTTPAALLAALQGGHFVQLKTYKISLIKEVQNFVTLNYIRYVHLKEFNAIDEYAIDFEIMHCTVIEAFNVLKQKKHTYAG
jgi:hypothetical protein